MFEYIVRSHVCLSVSVHVAFYFKLGFGWEGHGFEPGSCFFLSRMCFLKWSFVGGVGGGFL